MYIGSYALALWAMTHAPIGLVASLREMAIVIGSVFAWLLLKEPLTRVRLSIVVITAGALAIKGN